MKYLSLLTQLKALRAQLAPMRPQVIRIEGGFPKDYQPPAAAPLGSDLHHQARAFRSARAGAQTAASASDGREPSDTPAAKALSTGS